MIERLAAELAHISARHDNVQSDGECSYVLIPEFLLPPGQFNKEHTKLLFAVPIERGYPMVGPDDFFVDSDLRLADGSPAPGFNEGRDSSSGAAPVEGNWGWFSWHPDTWRPSASIEDGDNLMTFLRSVRSCLEGVEAT